MHGDLVFVDTSTDVLVADGLYLIADRQGYPQVRRLQANLYSDPPTLMIIADSAPDSKHTVEVETVSIVGKVVGRITRM
ncbi:hypothetical protein D9M72_647080 [compost metagenome]